MKIRKEDQCINFIFAGDLMLGGEFLSYSQKFSVELLHPFQYLTYYFNQADIVFINLEGPICQHGIIRPDVTAILSNHSEIVKYLSRFKICVLSLANNHIMDYGEAGLIETIKVLKENNLYFVGAGENSEKANNELIIKYRDINIAFLAFTIDEPNVRAVISDSNSAGSASYADIESIIIKIKRLKKKVDIICVSLHWGHEFFFYPSYGQVQIAHQLVDAGATCIIGHHPHVLQGLEKYKDSLILYSIGNLFLPPGLTISGRQIYRKKITKEFMLVKLTVDKFSKFRYKTIGGKVTKNYIILPYNPDGQKLFVQKVNKLSEFQLNSNYKQFWYNYKKLREKELQKDSLIEAFKKLSMISFKDLINTLTIDDLKRNIVRLFRVIFKFKRI